MAMDSATTDCAAFDETVVFLRHFKDLQDPRQPGKVSYPLDEILLLCLLAVLAGAECFTEIALFGVKKLAFLRRFRPFKDGTPAHDHLGDILASLDAEQFQRCFVAWAASLTGVPEGVIAIDGKTVRRSGNKRSGKARSIWCRPLRPVSVWCLARSRWRKNPTRSSRSPSFSTCWRSRGRLLPSMRWDASATSRKRSSTRRRTTSWR